MDVMDGVGFVVYGSVNVDEYCAQARRERGFWVWVAEVLSTHPPLAKRLDAVRRRSNLDAPSEPFATPPLAA